MKPPSLDSLLGVPFGPEEAALHEAIRKATRLHRSRKLLWARLGALRKNRNHQVDPTPQPDEPEVAPESEVAPIPPSVLVNPRMNLAGDTYLSLLTAEKDLKEIEGQSRRRDGRGVPMEAALQIKYLMLNTRIRSLKADFARDIQQAGMWAIKRNLQDRGLLSVQKMGGSA